jgi:hypothetical protein
VIGLNVRLEDVRDLHGLLRGRFEVGLDLELWIHHSAAGCPPSAEEVAGAAGLRGQEMPKNHGAPPFRFWSCHTPRTAIGSNTYFGFRA